MLFRTAKREEVCNVAMSSVTDRWDYFASTSMTSKWKRRSFRLDWFGDGTDPSAWTTMCAVELKIEVQTGLGFLKDELNI